jgi:hypothetical protein
MNFSHGSAAKPYQPPEFRRRGDLGREIAIMPTCRGRRSHRPLHGKIVLEDGKPFTPRELRDGRPRRVGLD